MTTEEMQKLLAPEAFKTAEDAEAAGRLIAQGYAGEFGRLCTMFGLDKAAEEAPAEAETKPEPKKKEADPEIGAELETLLTELGGIV